MATLEKIRSKSVFLIIVIGVALLAFIIGDALTNSRNIFGDHTTVAKVGSTKIDYTEYARKQQELQGQLEEARRQNPEQFANFDTQVLNQMAVEQLIQEKLVEDASDKAGIKVSGTLLRYYMLENPQSQEAMDVVRMLNQAGINVQTPQQAFDVIFNPKRNNMTDEQAKPYQQAWLAAEKQMERQLRMRRYQQLLSSTVKANDLDKRALYNDYINTQNVSLAFLSYGQLDPKKYPVTDAEAKAQYDKDKAFYEVEEPTKEISFIAVPVAASQADLNACKQLAASTMAAMQKGGALPKDIKKEGVALTKHSLRASDIPAGAVKDYVLSAPADSVKLISQNMQGFSIVRTGKREQQVDSIKVNIVSVAGEALGKRVMAALNAGLPADSLTARFSPDSVAPQLGQWLPLFTEEGPTNALPQEQLDSLMNAGGKYIAVQQNAQGMALASIVEKKAPVTICEYEEATYELHPSARTLNEARDKFEKFITVNNTAEKFNKAAEKAGYTVQKFTVTSSTPAVPRFQGFNQYYPDSRAVVRWVMIDGEPDQVSHLFESKSNLATPAFYAVAVDSEYDDYRPLTNAEVKQEVTEKVRRAKAGDEWVAKYKKSAGSVAQAAKAMGVQPRNVDSFRFGMGGVGDPAVAGRIAGSKADKKVIVIKGEDGVYVYQVLGAKKENIPFNDQMYQQQYYQFVNPDLFQMIKGDRKLKNNVYKFEGER